MWRHSCVALLLPALLLLWCSGGGGGGGGGGADAAPLLGLFSLLAGTNGTNIVSTLLLNHLQQKINTLEVIADLIAIATNTNTTDG